MTRMILLLLIAFAMFGQTHQPPVVPPTAGTAPDATLPNGRSQKEEILKQDHKKNLEDAATMAKLAQEVSEDLEKDDRYVMSLKTLKKLDEIEKLAKAVRGRLKRF